MERLHIGFVLGLSLLLIACGDSEDSSADGGGGGGGSGGQAGGSGSPDASTAPDAGGGELDFAAFDTAMAELIAEHELDGAGAVIVQKDSGAVHTASYGDFENDRVYLVMSSSKILSAGVLMRLADDGVLDMDAPIGDYVSAWGEGKPELTLAQLVSGSSGLIGILDDLLYAPYACQGMATDTLTQCATTIYTADDAADRKTPDTEFHYGGAPWQLAGGVAEAASGKSWAELIQDTYGACGASSLGYTNAAELFSIMIGASGAIDLGAVGYPTAVDGDPSVLPTTENPSIEGGAFITVPDYGKLLFMHLQGGTCDGTRVLSTAAVEQMQVDRIASYGGETSEQVELVLGSEGASVLEAASAMSGYGLGWWVDRDNPGVVYDPGAFGSTAWLDLPRGYGVFIAVEARFVHSIHIQGKMKPVVDQIFDAVE
jgi:CubicO group peptidase (beta-lactamase class C family)